MQMLPTFEKLIRQLKSVPYLASKNIYRVAEHFLEKDKKSLEAFCQILLEVKEHVIRCSRCYNWHEGGTLCAICQKQSRNKEQICIVETWHDLLAIEKSGSYHGVYHILGGALSPLEGVGPEHLTIGPLIKRVAEEHVKELIFATNPTPEGEATASFIVSKLEALDHASVSISKLASGVPIGSSLEYMDRVTIYKALCGRRPF